MAPKKKYRLESLSMREELNNSKEGVELSKFDESGSRRISEADIEEEGEDDDIFADQTDDDDELDQLPRWKRILRKILDNTVFTVMMTIITIYALFGDDLRILFAPKEADNYFYATTCVGIAAFTFEIVAASFVKPEYRFGFFFWLDVISTASMIFDIGWIFENDPSGSNATQIARAGRVSRAGTRAGRIVRIIRIIRLIRIVKLYKAATEAEAKREKAHQQKIHPLHRGSTLKGHHQHGRRHSRPGSRPPLRKGTSGDMDHHHHHSEIRGSARAGTSVRHAERTSAGTTDGFEKGRDAKGGHSRGMSHTETFTSETELLSGRGGHGLPAINAHKRGMDFEFDGASTDRHHPGSPGNRHVSVLSSHSGEHESGDEDDHHYNHHRVDADHTPLSINQEELVALSLQKQPKRNRDFMESTEEEDEFDESAFAIPKESRVGKKLSELTTKRVIILVLIMLIFLQLFEADTYFTDQQSYKNGIDMLVEYLDQTQTLAHVFREKYLQEMINMFYSEHKDADQWNNYNLIYLDLHNRPAVEYENLGDYRGEEVEPVYGADGESFAIFSKRQEVQYTALIGICRTVFVCIVLTLGALFFSKDANELVLQPIERMTHRVKKMAENPLDRGDSGRKKLEELEAQHDGKKHNEAEYETAILERAISKIVALLALGFGEAGSEIIQTNMKRGGDLDPLLPGKKIPAIFGFCDIRNFTDATEELQTDVMVFVNEIAEVVHSIVDRFEGAANKNIGDAFLLVWKFPKDQILKEKGNVTVKPNAATRNISDMALFSFVKIIGKINRIPKLLRYRDHPKLNARIENYKVKMGFGLHFGWAIEGAIGSVYKIDASYLSPNVNMASRLEAATKQYGVPLLVSGDLHDRLSKKAKNVCREIDTVTVKGSIKPMRLFTVDVETDHLIAGKDHSTMSLKMRHQRKKNVIKHNLNTPGYKAGALFYKDKDSINMRKFHDDHFDQIFSSGYKAYISGDWSQAKDRFDECFTINDHDGPTMTLYEYMRARQFVAPEKWEGYRELTEK